MKVTIKQDKYCYFHFIGSQAAPLNSTTFVPNTHSRRRRKW